MLDSGPLKAKLGTPDIIHTQRVTIMADKTEDLISLVQS